jgi:hypothetical protein
MYVRNQSGQQETFAITDIGKLSFATGNMLITEENGTISTYAIDDIRYVNFTDLVTNNLDYVEYTDNEILAYPIPAGNLINLKFQENIKSLAQISITALNGKIIYTKDIELVSGQNNIQINISNFPPGMYCCVLQFENNIKTVKFIKN